MSAPASIRTIGLFAYDDMQILDLAGRVQQKVSAIKGVRDNFLTAIWANKLSLTLLLPIVASPLGCSEKFTLTSVLVR